MYMCTHMNVCMLVHHVSGTWYMYMTYIDTCMYVHTCTYVYHVHMYSTDRVEEYTGNENKSFMLKI